MSGEFEAIARIAAVAGAAPPGETWIGDDAAAVRWHAGWLLLAADAVVAGVHADLDLTGVDDLGWKAMAANLSDIAAMGGVPRHALVTVAGPAGTDLDGLYEGILEASRRYDCPVVGGDLANSPVLVVTVALTGSVEEDPVFRSGARPGDTVFVTGPLGSSAAGLRLLRDGSGGEEGAALRAAHARPVPLVREGLAAARAGASAMIDVSDGLAADLGHIADSSGVGFALDEVPVAPGATLEEAVGGGEDYQLVFSAPDPAAVRAAFEGLRQPVAVGRVVADASQRTLAGRPLAPEGWQHRW